MSYQCEVERKKSNELCKTSWFHVLMFASWIAFYLILIVFIIERYRIHPWCFAPQQHLMRVSPDHSIYRHFSAAGRQILSTLARCFSLHSCVCVCVCVLICVWRGLTLETSCEWKIKVSPAGIRKRKKTAVHCCSVGLPVRLCGNCESVFGGISGNRPSRRVWQRQTPCGLENMPGPEPTWAKTGDTAPLCCSFSTRLPVSLLSVSSGLLFLASPPPYFCPSLFLFYLSPSFFSSSFVCRFTAPPVSHYSNPIYEGDKHMHTHCRSFYASLFLSLSLPFLSSTFSLKFTWKKTVNTIFCL